MTTVLARLLGGHHLESLTVDRDEMSGAGPDWDVPIAGTVIGVLVNDEDAFLAREEEFAHAPYLAPPRAPILYLKPPNTWNRHRASVVVPAGTGSLEVGAAVGVVIGETATRVTPGDALRHVLGYVPVNDVSIPHESIYRPAIRERCQDGFCPIGPWIMPASTIRSSDALVLRTFVNGRLRAETTTTRLLRRTAQLIADISDFMTLAAGDVLLLGPGADRPQVQAGDTVRIDIAGVGSLENPFIAAMARGGESG
jgi:5-oxopent-3-ene-1,2,5-tricarboxylate decarboxylase/2-hydroxyhepta-2,4-diene-1,7-dioate isomerase